MSKVRCPIRVGQAWSKEEDIELIRLKEQEEEVRDIGITLKRTEEEILCRLAYIIVDRLNKGAKKKIIAKNMNMPVPELEYLVKYYYKKEEMNDEKESVILLRNIDEKLSLLVNYMESLSSSLKELALVKSSENTNE